MSEGLIGTNVFGGGGGCGSCPSVRVDVATAAVLVNAGVNLPSAPGVSPGVNYEYCTILPGTGPFGRGRPNAGSLGVKLISLDSYGRAFVTREDGTQVGFLNSNGVYCADTSGAGALTCDDPEAPTTWKHTLPDGTYYVYDGSGALPGERPALPYFAYDANGNGTHFYYDASDRMVRIDDSVGRSTYFGYDGSDTTVAYVQDCRGATTYFTYDTSDYLTQARGPEGCITTYDYDGYGRIASIEDPAGYVAYFGYDPGSPSQAIASIEFDSGVTYFQYMTPLAVRVVDPLENVTYYITDGYNLRSVKSPLGDTTSYRGDYETTDALGNTSQFDYNSLGLPSESMDALGGWTSDDYDSDGNRTSSRDKNGNHSYYTYDATNNMTSATDPLDATTYYEYDAQGHRTKEKDALGNPSYYGYDALGNMALTQNALGFATYYGYDVVGNQTAVVSPAPNSSSVSSAESVAAYYEYDLNDRLTLEKDALGNTKEYGYDGRGMKTVELNPRGYAAYYTYDASRRMTASTNYAGNTQYFAYDLNGNQTSQTDERGNATAMSYDAAGRLSKTTDALSHASYYYYDAAGNQTCVKTPAPTASSLVATYYYYDALNRQKGLRDALGNETYYVFDLGGNQTAVLAPAPNAASPVGATIPTYYYYDELNRQKGMRNALGNHTYYVFDAAGNRTAQVDPAGNATTYACDELNRQSRVTDAAGASTYYEYDGAGNQSAVVSPAPNSTSVPSAQVAAYYRYDAAGRRTQVTNALGAATYYEYDAVGNQTAVIAPAPNTFAPFASFAVSYFNYDAMNRRTCSVDSLGAATYYGYDAAGNQVYVGRSLTAGWGTQAWGSSPYGGDVSGILSTYYTYDALNRQTVLKDPLGHETETVYDAAGNRYAVVDALGNTTYFFYDDANRQTAVVNPLGIASYYAYDAAGNRTAVVVPAPNSSVPSVESVATYYTYDLLNRQTCVTDPLAGKTYFEYDSRGNRTQVKDALGNATYYAHDAVNRVSAVTDALMQSESYSYDLAGNLLSHTNASGGTAYYAYDDGSRRTAAALPDGRAHYYTYDAPGNMTGAEDSRGWTYFAYDAKSRLTSATTPNNVETIHAYDVLGNRTLVFALTSAAYYSYDAASRMEYAKSGDATMGTAYYAFDAGNRLTEKLLGNGCCAYYEYDAASRVTSLDYRLSDGSQVVYFGYDYDAGSRIISIRREAGTAIYYSYDDADRLTGEEWKNSGGTSIYAFEWDYDAVGNRTYESYNGEQTYYTYDAANELAVAHELPGDTHTYFSYDARGNCLTMVAPLGTTYYTYNSGNLMTSIKFRDGVINYFYYDATGNRYAIHESTGTTYLTYDRDGLCPLLERDLSDNVTAQNTRGYSSIPGIGDRAAGRINASGEAYYQYDVANIVGATHRILRPDGAVAGTFEYNAYGRYLCDEAPPEGATGGFSSPAYRRLKDDPEKRHYLTRTRTYDGILGRFLQRDMLFLGGRYMYTYANPVNLADVYGLEVVMVNRRTLSPEKKDVPIWIARERGATDTDDLNEAIAEEIRAIEEEQEYYNWETRRWKFIGPARFPVPRYGNDFLFPWLLGPVLPQAENDIPGSALAGTEAGFVVGGGLTVVYCTDENGCERRMKFWKWCVGAMATIGTGGGIVKGMSGEHCKPDRYRGYFLETGGSVGPLGANVDVGVGEEYLGRNRRFPVPDLLDPTGVVEGSLGFSGGMKFGLKCAWCRYYFLGYME